MRKLAVLAAVVSSVAVTAVAGATHALAAGPSACASVSVLVSVNGSSVVNQSVSQCAP
jgi:hypothetical protein